MKCTLWVVVELQKEWKLSTNCKLILPAHSPSVWCKIIRLLVVELKASHSEMLPAGGRDYRGEPRAHMPRDEGSSRLFPWRQSRESRDLQ